MIALARSASTPAVLPLTAAAGKAVTPRAIGRAALHSLYQELVCYPKPGLVSPMDPGGHTDMDAGMFLRSLFSLRRYFRHIAAAGMNGAPFREMQAMGIAAERRMLLATGGINTHRGAIFNLGLLAAAAGRLVASGGSIRGDTLGQEIRKNWGRAILDSTNGGRSHGREVALRYGVGGAREEAAQGFAAVFGTGLPVLQQTLKRLGDRRLALVQTLFSLIASVADTNLLYRGGVDGLRFAQAAASDFLRLGGVCRHDWEIHAVAIHRAFVARSLSPGGSADLLAATFFVYQLKQLSDG